MRRRHRNSTKRRASKSAGFTLIEMLVSVTLVLLLMVMFAEIFGLVTGSMTQQRGLARNDRRGRAPSTVIKSDLEKRTFRHMVPFDRGEDLQGIDANLAKRLGYFYISENDPNNDSDDVLQFTILTSIATPHGPDTSPLTGRIGTFGLLGNAHPTLGNPTGVPSANYWQFNTPYSVGDVVVPLVPPNSPTGLPEPPYRFVCVKAGTSGAGQPVWSSVGGVKVVDGDPTDPASNAEWMIEASNQPEWDDGFLNNSMTSAVAEVSYFLRNGNLYRRVVLLRDEVTGDTQPGTIGGAPYFNRNNTFYATNANFYEDFDLSAHYGVFGASVNGRQSLENKYVNAVPTWQHNKTYRHGDIVIPRIGNNQFLVYVCLALPDGFGNSANTEPAWPTVVGNTVVDGDVTWEAQSPPYVDINGNGSLDFGDELVATGGVKALPLAMPYFRFGHHHLDLSTALGLANAGRPREFVNGLFTGRFTHEETSHPDFRYPHRPSTIGNAGGAVINNGFPYLPGALQNPLTIGADGVVDQYRGGSRRGEDVLLTNVHSFDIKVWDDGFIVTDPGGTVGDFDDVRGEWVNIGGDAVNSPSDVGLLGSGFYALAGKGPSIVDWAYGPHATLPPNQPVPIPPPIPSQQINRIFDTWHPGLPADPPLKPMLMNFRNFTGVAQSRTLANQFLRGTWSPNPVDPGMDNIPATSDDLISPNDANKGTPYLLGQLVVPTNATSFPLVYQATPVGTNPQNLTGYVEPVWPIEAGQSVFNSPEDLNKNGKLDNEDTNGNGMLDAGEDLDLDGILDPNEDFNGDGVLTGYRWTALQNIHPLRAIRITIRYHDVQSDQVRQLTIVHSLVDNR